MVVSGKIKGAHEHDELYGSFTAAKFEVLLLRSTKTPGLNPVISFRIKYSYILLTCVTLP